MHPKSNKDPSVHYIYKNDTKEFSWVQKINNKKECHNILILHVTLFNLVSQYSEFTVPQSLNQYLPCTRLPFPNQPFLEDSCNDILWVTKRCLSKALHSTSCLVMEKEYSKCFVLCTDMLGDFELKEFW